MDNVDWIKGITIFLDDTAPPSSVKPLNESWSEVAVSRDVYVKLKENYKKK